MAVMAAERFVDTVTPVTRAERVERIQRTQEALNWSDRYLAERAGIDRSTLGKVLAGDGSVTEEKIIAVERALDDLMRELFPGAGAENVIRLRVPMPGAEDLVIEGPPEDVDALVAAVERILANRQKATDA